MTTELFDNAISFNRLIWIMSDEDCDKLFAIAKQHVELVKEHGKKNTTMERRQIIKNEIELLRKCREKVMKKYE